MSSLRLRRLMSGVCTIAAIGLTAAAVQAQSLSFAPVQSFPASVFQASMPPQQEALPQQQEAMPQERTTEEPQANEQALPENLRRQVVNYPTHEAPGTIIVDTPHTYLYYVLGNGKAMRYGIGVGREGFTWSGVRTVGRKAEWPDWVPPQEMLVRQPYLPRWMAGGPGNPLGARAMYLAGTVYRIHGTNAPSTIGKHVSSGCIRMLNEDVIDLYKHVDVGTKVVVLPDHGVHPVAHRSQPRQRTAAATSLPSVD
jgi:lipoprotein-anchoring transpeptidase ErfK/SrfK